MSMFEDGHYRWRETYFVVFDVAKRPTVQRVKKSLTTLGRHYELKNVRGDDAGLLESLTVLSPDDFAALDISYLEGEEVLEQGAQLADDLQRTAADPAEKMRIKRIRHYNARFDVLHFEQLAAEPDADEDDEMLDPGTMLIVLETLAKLTDGIAVDPQSGTII
jgi:hypothetical protein